MIPLRRMGAAALLALTIGIAGSARAAEPASLGVFNDWTAYTYKASDTNVCYVVSQPKSSEAAKKVKRDPIFFIVTHMPGRSIKGEVSTIIGYPFKEATTVQLKVGEAEFELFTNGDGAWADTKEKEKKIVAAMKAGQKFTVTGTSWKGTETTDSYSLSGFSAAMDKIDSSCK
ncbi:MAG: invasion associated locus B family protein [Aestuariivirga sp.]